MSDRFCERCGAALAVLQPAGEGGPGAGAVGPGEGGAVSSVAAVRTAAPPSVCPSCGASDGVDADGFCLSCGVRSVRPRDRMECDLGAVVAVSDKEYISEEDLPLEFHFAQLEPRGGHSENLFEEATNTFERNYILRALEKCGWNVTATAEYLGIPLSTLKYKMDKLDVRQIAKRLRGA